MRRGFAPPRPMCQTGGVATARSSAQQPFSMQEGYYAPISQERKSPPVARSQWLRASKATVSRRKRWLGHARALLQRTIALHRSGSPAPVGVAENLPNGG